MKPRIAAVLLAAAGLGASPGTLPATVAAADSGLGPVLRLKASYPGTGVVDAASDVLHLQFSTPVDFATLTAANFVLADGPDPVAGTFDAGFSKKGEPDARVVLFTPDAPLAANHWYRVHVRTGVRSALGRKLDDPVDFVFRTDPLKPTDAVLPVPPGTRLVRAPRLGPRPKVTWSEPLAGMGSVFSDRIRVRFNRLMDVGTVNVQSVRLLLQGQEIPGRVDYPGGGDPKEMIFQPESPLFPGSDFELHIDADVTSERGRSLGDEVVIGFGTSPLKDGVRPLKPGDFVPGPDFAVRRAFHTGVTVAGGDVLLAGGETSPGSPTATCELFRPAGDAMETVGSLATARRMHAAVRMKDGQVLATGGFGPGGPTLASAEVWNPLSRTWSSVASMTTSRAHHTLTLLADGKVLAAGGFTTDPGALSYATTGEVYDPVAGTWSLPTPLVLARGGHTANLTLNGRVMLVGGAWDKSAVAEVYDPVTRRFRRTMGSARNHRIFGAAVTLHQDAVLVAGGGPSQAEIYDSVSETFTPSGDVTPQGTPVGDSPWYPTLTSLPGSRVLFLGGLLLGGADGGGDLVLAQLQLWDGHSLSGSGSFSPMLFTVDPPRAAHTVNDLGDGRYLIAGGLGAGFAHEHRTTILTPSE